MRGIEATTQRRTAPPPGGEHGASNGELLRLVALAVKHRLKVIKEGVIQMSNGRTWSIGRLARKSVSVFDCSHA